jgi:hypothetical protein
MFQFHPVGILALVAVAMCWSLAVVLYRTSAAGSVARKLALLLVVEGVTLISTGFVDLFFSEKLRAHPFYAGWMQFEVIIHTLGDCAMLALYPPFLAAALRTKLTQPFARKRVRMAVNGVSAALFFAVFMTPMWLGATLLYLALAVVFWFALIASIHAWRLANGAAKTRARAFAIAFGIRDICWGFVYGGAIWMIWFGQYHVVDPDASSPIYIVYALGTLFAVPLIAYGILRTQLFDIDLRIRWTIKQSTLAAAVIAIIFILSEGADRLLSAELGDGIGLLAAALVVFFLAPLQRFAERVATAAMPNTENTPEYAAFRKMQVYEAAIAEALDEGGISKKERSLLARLRESLDISETDAQAIELDLRDQERDPEQR